jgi:hypothetical protein
MRTKPPAMTLIKKSRLRKQNTLAVVGQDATEGTSILSGIGDSRGNYNERTEPHRH